MNSAPLLSIIIPYFNSHTYFKDLLESINGQTVKDIEVIIIDDKSTKESSEKLKTIIALYPQLNIKIIVNEVNIGVAKSRNQGFSMANGNYVTFIDSDDLVCGKYSFECRVEFLQKNPGFSGIGGYDYRIDEKNAVLLSLPDKKISYFRQGVKNPENLRFIYAENMLRNSTESASALFFATGSCLFRRADLIDFPFDPEYETEDDIEWLLRFLDKKSIKLEMIPFHCRRVHKAQYHLQTPSQITQKVIDLAKEIVKTEKLGLDRS